MSAHNLNSEPNHAEQFHTAIFDHAQIGIELYDRQGMFIKANRTCLDMCGVTNAGAMTRVNLFDDPNLSAERRAALHRGMPVSYEASHDLDPATLQAPASASGAVFFTVKIEPITESPGQAPSGYVVLMQDITERKNLERSLQESKDQYANLVSKIPVGVYLLHCQQSGEFVFDYVSPTMAKMFDVHTDSMLRDSAVGFRCIDPDDLRLFTALTLKGSQTCESFEWEGRAHVNGIDKWLRIVSTPEQMETGCVCWHGVVSDVTDHRRAEESERRKIEELDRYFASSLDLLCIANVEGRFIRLNPEWENVLGYSLSELEGRSFIELVHPEDVETTLAALSKLGGQERVLSFVNRYRCVDGSYRWIEWRSQPLGEFIYAVARDITDRKLAEASLANERNLLSTLINTIPDRVYVKDTESRFILNNSAHMNALGVHSQAELLGKSDREFREKEIADRYIADDRQVMQSGEALFNREEVAILPNGQKGTVLSSKVPLRDLNGDVIGIVGVSRDITERKYYEDAFHEKERYQRALLDNFPFAVWLKDTESRFLAVNQMFARTFGFSGANELVGKTDYDIAPREIAEAYREDDRAVLESRHMKNVEEQVIGQGTVDWFETYKAPVIDDNGELLGTVGFMRDITERMHSAQALKDSQSLYHSFMEQLPNAVFRKDRDGRFVIVNPQFCRLKGLTKEEIIGRTPREIAERELPREGEEGHSVKYANTGEEIHALILHNGNTYETEEEYRAADGSIQFMHVMRMPVHDSGGNIIGTQGIMFDITARKQAEQLLLDMQRRESIGILAGGIAHDFNNLLGSMMGNVSLAQNKMPPDHPSYKNMEKALLAMERAAQLTQQMLAYSGKGKFQNSTIDLVSTVREYVSLFSVSLQKNVKLVTQLPSMPVYVNGDPGQIEQIIMNLIINGGEAIGDNQGTVTMTLTEVTLGQHEVERYSRITNTGLKDGRYALLELSDTGIGMTNETRAKIFDPFFTTKFTGRGLGLSAVLGIIRGHNGGITIDSVIGKGTKFSVVLPAVVLPAPAEETETDGSASASVITTTILVIDDELDIATTAQEMLESAQYSVAVELNPIHGIERYREHHTEIGLVLLDLTMPEMSGKEVVDALQRIDPDVKIIISSGYSEEEVTKKIGSAKVSAFIQKPYRLNSLLSRVQSVVQC